MNGEECSIIKLPTEFCREDALDGIDPDGDWFLDEEEIPDFLGRR